MYAHKDSAGIVTILNGAEIFMYQAGNTPLTLETVKMLCLCRKYKYTKFPHSEIVWKHLVNRGFNPHYYIWFYHGNGDNRNEASSSTHFEDVREESSHMHYESSYPQKDQVVDHDSMHDMVTYAFREITSVVAAKVENVEMYKFYTG